MDRLCRMEGSLMDGFLIDFKRMKFGFEKNVKPEVKSKFSLESVRECVQNLCLD